MFRNQLTNSGPLFALLASLLAVVAATGWLLIPPLRFRSERRPQPPQANLSELESVSKRLDEALLSSGTAGKSEASQEFQRDSDSRAVSGLHLQSSLPVAGRIPILDWARRVSLGLNGTIPSLEEIRQLESQPLATREAWWLEHLLADRRTSDHLAERLGRAIVGVENGPFILYRRRRFIAWLSDQLSSNRPYDEVVRELIASEGIWTEKPAVNFVTVTTDIDGTGQPSPIRLAARTSRSFLAMRIDCLECHDDFLGTIQIGSAEGLRGGQQADFHRLAAFFSTARNSLAGVRDDLEAEPYRFTLLDEETATEFQPGVPLHPNLLLAAGSPRQRLAMWLTHPSNQQFARATVNRVWAIVFGQPLVVPIDDIPPTADVPRALDLLADDFVKHGYDLHRLLRLMAGSEAMRARGRVPDANTDPGAWSWDEYPAVRLRPEQVAHSLLQSSTFTTLDTTAHVLRRLIGSAQENEFVNRYGDFGENEFDPRSETVTQRLLVLNGNLVREQLEQGFGSPSRLAALAPNPETALEILFLVTLTRRPHEDERTRLVPSLQAAWAGERELRLQDLYWALLNSAEFASAR